MRRCYLLAILMVLVSGTAIAQLPMQPMIISGETVPGTGQLFGTFADEPRINGHGDVAFAGFMGDSTMAVFGGGRGEIQVYAKRGDPAAGTNGLVYNNLDLFGFSDVGQVVIHGDVQWTTGINQFNDEFAWAGSAGNLQRVGREDDPVTPGAHVQYSGVSTPYMSPLGTLTYTRGGLYQGPAENIQPLLMPQDPADGSGDDRFDRVYSTGMSDNGLTVVDGDLRDPEGSNDSGTGVWLVNSALPHQSVKVARGRLLGNEGTQPGDIAPGTAVEFVNPYPTSINGHGHVAIYSQLNTSTNNTGIWVGPAGGLKLVARKGDPLPVPGGSYTLVDFSGIDGRGDTTPMITGQDDVVFLAKLAGPNLNSTNDRAMFVGDSPADLKMIVRTGDHAPGTPNGVVFQRFSVSATRGYDIPVVNNLGQMVFYGVVSGPGVTTSNDLGIWATTPNGLVLVAREGDSVQLAPDVSGTISELQLSMHRGSIFADAGGTSLNDRNELALGLYLGSHAAVVKVQIPGPVGPLTGDFNQDGVVDAGDYIFWKKTGGSTTDYRWWRAYYGDAATPASASTVVDGAAVPEPASLLLVVLATGGLSLRRLAPRRRRGR